MGMKSAETRRQESQNEWQAEQNDTDRELQKYMAQLTADLEQKMWQEQFEKSNEQWAKQLSAQSASQIDTYNKTQSPAALAQQFKDIGINPVAALSSGGLAGSVPSQSSPSVSSPSGVHPSPGSPSGHSATSVGDEMTSLAQVIHSIGSFAKDSTSAYQTMELLGSQVELNMSQALRDKKQAVYQDMYNAAYKNFGDKKMAAEFMLDVANIQLLQNKGETEKAQQLALKAKSMLDDSLTTKNDIENIYLNDSLASIIELNNSQSNLNKARVGTEKSEQALNYANAESTNYYNKMFRDNPHLVDEMASQIERATKQAKYNNQISKEQAEQMEFLTEKLRFADSHKEFDYYFDKIMEISDKVEGYALDFTKVGLFKQYADTKRQELDLNERKFNSVEESDELNYYDEQGRKHHVKGTRYRPPKTRR